MGYSRTSGATGNTPTWPSSSLSRSLWAGGGTDEVLWELVAAAMKPDYDSYAELIGRGNA